MDGFFSKFDEIIVAEPRMLTKARDNEIAGRVQQGRSPPARLVRCCDSSAKCLSVRTWSPAWCAESWGL